MTEILPFRQEPGNNCTVDAGDPARHPISRWYVVPLVHVLAERLAETRCRPTHATLLGLAVLIAATSVIAGGWPLWGALLVWLAWCADRFDGALARAQGSSSGFGAWLDANLDEAGDIALHAACASCAAMRLGAAWPWALFAAFVGAKYLWQYGRQLEQEIAGTGQTESSANETAINTSWRTRVRGLVRLVGNADLRVHALIGFLACSRPEWELGLVAAYFGSRCAARVLIVQRRLRQLDSVSAATDSAPDAIASLSAREVA